MAKNLRLLWLNLALGLAYAASGWLGLQVPFSGEAITLAWPPSGIAFAALWLGGIRLLPGLMLGAAGLNFLAFGSPVFALLVGPGNALPALLALLALRRLRAGRPLLADMGGLIGFLAVAVALSPMVSAGIGVMAGMLGGVDIGSPLSGWFSWWLGDAMGVLIIAPPLLVLFASNPGRPLLGTIGARRHALAITLLTGLLLAGLASSTLPAWFGELGRLALFCVTIWAALRLGLAGATLVTAVIATTLTVLTARGIGPFVATDYHGSFALLHGALGVLAVTGLALAVTAENLRRVMHGEREARRQAEQALARLRGTQDELIQAEKMASLGRLVAGIAHEVATPVGTALSASTRLAQETRGIQQALATATLRREQMQDYIEATALAARILQSNMERAARLIESFKHVAVDRTRQDRRRLDLAGYVEEVLISLRPQTRKTPHAISLTGASRLAVDLYPDAVAQLITNLVVNAVTHAFPDGRAGRIEISLRGDSDGWVEVRVADDGIGISPDSLPHIFEPFFTTRRSHGGSGLGLYLACCQVNQRLGGSLSVTCPPDGGTLFLARFPAQSPTYQPVAEPAEEEPPAPIALAEKRLSA